VADRESVTLKPLGRFYCKCFVARRLQIRAFDARLSVLGGLLVAGSHCTLEGTLRNGCVGFPMLGLGLVGLEGVEVERLGVALHRIQW